MTRKVKKITMTLLAKENGMKNSKASENQTMCRILLIACATALAVAFTVALPRPAHADDVPANIQVPPGNEGFLVGHGEGTQNYICLPSGSGFAFSLFTPQATLFNDHGKAVTTHFFSPNPSENGTIRATWQHSRDTSAVWGNAIASSPSPVSGSIPLLLLQVVGSESGPTGGDKLTAATYIQRLNTAGGVAPAATTCDEATEVGSRELVPYTADYFFYKPRK
jgi:Protein of unknown function (DUF3455)